MDAYLRELLKPQRPIRYAKSPMVSFLMPTYGRAAKQPEMLNEAVWWCSQQTHDNIEVLILNDAPKQTLKIDQKLWPMVRIINWPERIPDLGSKMNLAVLLAAGEICVPAEDDDISLPHRAEQVIRMLRGHDCWFPMLWLYAHYGQPYVIDGNGYGYTSSAYRRDMMLNNHPVAISGHDMEAAGWMRKHLRYNAQVLENPNDVSYVYRWGVSPLHLSGSHDPISAFHNNHPGRDGVYEIKPAVREDWVGLTQEAAGRYPTPAPVG